jgi:hypothetical protein
MNPDLERLIRLQSAETDLRRVEAELPGDPRQRAELEAALARERGRLDQGREAQGQTQKARRQHEADLQDLESKRSRYKGQLMEVKTNKEYTAMLHEIEGVEREIRARRTRSWRRWSAARPCREVKAERRLFKEAEGRARGRSGPGRARARRSRRSARGCAAERDAVAATIVPDALRAVPARGPAARVAVAEAATRCARSAT